jgi:hypothetical protein
MNYSEPIVSFFFEHTRLLVNVSEWSNMLVEYGAWDCKWSYENEER